jgi:hypothetical protein
MMTPHGSAIAPGRYRRRPQDDPELMLQAPCSRGSLGAASESTQRSSIAVHRAKNQGRIVRHRHEAAARYKPSVPGYQTHLPSLSCVWIRRAIVLFAAAIEHR